MDFSDFKNELTNKLLQSVPDYSKYPDYRYETSAKELVFDEPESDDERDAIKRYKRSEIATSSVGFIIVIAFIVFVYNFISQMDISDPDPMAIVFLVVFFGFFIVGILIKPLILLFSKSKIAKCEVVGTRIHHSSGSKSKTTYRVIVAQSSTKVICDQIKISSKLYRTLNSGDQVYAIKCGNIYGAWKINN